MMFRLHLIVFVAALSVLACARPESTEHFVRQSQTVDGCYVFEVEMDDSLVSYDFSFYTKVASPTVPSSLRLDICWTSPSGVSGEETVYMDPSVVPNPYRSSVVPSEYGKWSLKVRIPDAPESLLGLGFINKRNGTR